MSSFHYIQSVIRSGLLAFGLLLFLYSFLIFFLLCFFLPSGHQGKRRAGSSSGPSKSMDIQVYSSRGKRIRAPRFPSVTYPSFTILMSPHVCSYMSYEAHVLVPAPKSSRYSIFSTSFWGHVDNRARVVTLSRVLVFMTRLDHFHYAPV